MTSKINAMSVPRNDGISKGNSYIVEEEILDHDSPNHNDLHRIGIKINIPTQERQLISEDKSNNLLRRNSSMKSSQGRSQKDANELMEKRESWKFKGVPELELSWRDIKMTAHQQSGKIIDEKIVLNNVNGRVRSGEALAIIGSSGAGKTTLLNLLSMKIKSRNLKSSGDILLNGNKIDVDQFKSIVAYVMQDDILEPVMTPAEILLFTAKLKLRLSQEDSERKVYQMLQDLNLIKCKDTKVGSALIRGVSGGERKRTSIGVELISDPRIVFLDEPTTGLDSYNAYEVIILLRQLAATGKLIIFTIHQPASEIFDLLDKLCILALGRTVYFGSSEHSYDAFESINIPVPRNYNPFEHFMEVTTQQAVNDKRILNVYPQLAEIDNLQTRYSTYIEYIAETYEKHKDKYVDNYPPLTIFSQETEKMMQLKNTNTNFFYEYLMLYSKNTVVSLRNPKLFKAKIFQAAFTAVLISILFINVNWNDLFLDNKIFIRCSG